MKIPYPSKNAWIIGAMVTIGVLVALNLGEGVTFLSRPIRTIKTYMGLPLA